VSTGSGRTRSIRKALHLERGIGQAERRLRKSLRQEGVALEGKRRPPDVWQPWLNRPLQSQAEVDAALAEAAACGLPPHPSEPKNWDLLIALGSILAATSHRDAVLEMGATHYTKLLPWLYLYGYRRLVGIDLVTPQDVVEGPLQSYRMDLTKTTFKDGAFGAIACLSVIEHGVSFDAYLAEAWRLLRPGGVLITSTDFWCSPLDVEGKEAYGTQVRIFVPDDIKALADKARKLGFRLDGSLDLRCGDPVVTWTRVEVSYTFVNMVLHKPSTPRDRLLAPIKRATSGNLRRSTS
jgi:SAM-dependent methyltransferase